MKDLWSYLKDTNKPIVMYGTGNGADKIFSVLDSYGIEVKDIFASDGFVRDRSFHGKKVISYSDTVAKYRDDMIILLAFGSDRAEVTEFFYTLDKRHELYAPDVPIVGSELFDAEFYGKNRDRIELARELLCDDASRAVYDGIISYRLSGRIGYIKEHTTELGSVMRDILHPSDYRLSVDLGAFNGDTATELAMYASGIERIIALEPDSKNFSRLISCGIKDIIEPYNLAAWSGDEELHFSKGGGRAIRHEQSGKTVCVRGASLDRLLCGRAPDFIKIDVEGAEREAIVGAEKSIRAFSPELQVALYHRSADIFELPIMIHGINPEYKLCLRRFPSVPAWDINLFATKERIKE